MKEYLKGSVKVIEYDFDDWLSRSEPRLHFVGFLGTGKDGVRRVIPDQEVAKIRAVQNEIYQDRVTLAFETEKQLYQIKVDPDSSVDIKAYHSELLKEYRHILGIETSDDIGKGYHNGVDVDEIRKAYKKFLLPGKRPYSEIVPSYKDWEKRFDREAYNDNKPFGWPDAERNVGKCIRAEAVLNFLNWISKEKSEEKISLSSYINHPKSDQIIQFLQDHYKTAKPKKLAGLIVALEEKGIFFKEESVVDLHYALKIAFGDRIGTRRGFGSQLKIHREISIGSKYNTNRSSIDSAIQLLEDVLA